MKAILISIKPKYVAKILNGEKTIEIRKTCPKQLRGDTPIKPEPVDVYIYCTKGTQLIKYVGDYYATDLFKNLEGQPTTPKLMNGKVVAKFTLNKVEEIKCNLAMRFFTESANEKKLLEKSCLDSDQLFWYLAPQELKAKCCGYAWYISNLEIFDKPKELSEFRKLGKKCEYQGRDTFCDYCSHCDCIGDELTKAPQSWQFIEVDE